MEDLLPFPIPLQLFCKSSPEAFGICGGAFIDSGVGGIRLRRKRRIRGERSVFLKKGVNGSFRDRVVGSVRHGWLWILRLPVMRENYCR